jgi:hypothetical protein
LAESISSPKISQDLSTISNAWAFALDAHIKRQIKKITFFKGSMCWYTNIGLRIQINFIIPEGTKLFEKNLKEGY